MFQPIRRLYACTLSSGACETYIIVTSPRAGVGGCRRRCRPSRSTSGNLPRSWAEHEVVDEQLSAAVEELARQRARALVGLEAVLLLERDPGQLAALACELFAHPGVFLLALEQFLASRQPFLTGADLVLRYRICLLFV